MVEVFLKKGAGPLFMAGLSNEPVFNVECMLGAAGSMGGLTTALDTPPKNDSDEEEAGPNWQCFQSLSVLQDPAPPLLPSAAPLLRYAVLSSKEGLKSALSVKA